MKRTGSSTSSGRAKKAPRLYSLRSGVKRAASSTRRGRGHGSGHAKGKLGAATRSKHKLGDDDDDDDEKMLQEFNDRDEVVRQMALTSAANRYDNLCQTLLSATADIMEPAAESLLPSATPSHRDSLWAEGKSREVERPENHANVDEEEDDDDASRKRVYSLATWAMYTMVRHFHHLAAAAGTPEGLVEKEMEGHATRSHDSDSPLTPLDLARQRQAKRTAQEIRAMPPHLSQKLFKLLREHRASILSTRVWTRMFFAQPWMDDADNDQKVPSRMQSEAVTPLTTLDLEGLDQSQVLDRTIRSPFFLRTPGVIGPQMEMINLNGMSRLSDKCLAELIGPCLNLRRLFLKACANVGDLTLDALPRHSLQLLNISFTKGPATTPALLRMVRQCRELRVLKMVGVANVKDSWLVKLNDENEAVEQQQQQQHQQETLLNTTAEPDIQQTATGRPLQYLRNLKVSHTSLGDRGLKALLGLCGRTLERLDISSTHVTRVSMIIDYCTWESGEVAGEGAAKDAQYSDSDRDTDTVGELGEARVLARRHKRLRSETRLEKLNLTRVCVQSHTEFDKLLEGIPPGSLHTLLLGYLTVASRPLDAVRLVSQVKVFLEWTRKPPSPPIEADITRDSDRRQASKIHSSTAAATSTSTTYLGVRRDLNACPFRYLHTLSFFGCKFLSQILFANLNGRGLGTILQIFAPHLRRLELGWTGVRAAQLRGILAVRPAFPVPHPISPDHSITSTVLYGMGEQIYSLGVEEKPNRVLEELGLDGCTVDGKMVEVLVACRRLERLSLISAIIDDQQEIERLIKACPRLKSLDLTSCRGIDLAQRRNMLEHVRGHSKTSNDV